MHLRFARQMGRERPTHRVGTSRCAGRAGGNGLSRGIGLELLQTQLEPPERPRPDGYP